MKTQDSVDSSCVVSPITDKSMASWEMDFVILLRYLTPLKDCATFASLHPLPPPKVYYYSFIPVEKEDAPMLYRFVLSSSSTLVIINCGISKSSAMYTTSPVEFREFHL